MLQVMIHAPTRAALMRARGNVANLLAADSAVTIELVINNEAVGAALAERDDATAPYLVICENSLRAAGLAAPDGVRTTPAAVLHIVRRQAQGWLYFRA